MQIPGGLQEATLIRRYKRFLADVSITNASGGSHPTADGSCPAEGSHPTADGSCPADGSSTITIHCPNTGSMKNCMTPGSRVWFSTTTNPGRKYPHTWEVVEVAAKWLAGINTARANKLVQEAIKAGHIKELTAYPQIRTEVNYGQQGSRIDLLLEAKPETAEKISKAGRVDRVDRADNADKVNRVNNADKANRVNRVDRVDKVDKVDKTVRVTEHLPPCYVEVKNVTLGEPDGLGLFPDAVTQRGQKHLRELMKVADQGARAVLMFCVQHTGIERVAPADEIDPEYGRLLRQAHDNGVEILAYRAHFNLSKEDCKAEISLQDPIPIVL